jgi:5-hydroxyisourate hydrolase
MSTLSTHVLDAVAGAPAHDVGVALTEADQAGGWTPVHAARTDGDGRVTAFGTAGLGPGVYRLVFDTGAYFAAAERTGFYPEVSITFVVDEERHYHVPLLLSPFAYSTYRGS